MMKVVESTILRCHGAGLMAIACYPDAWRGAKRLGTEIICSRPPVPIKVPQCLHTSTSLHRQHNSRAPYLHTSAAAVSPIWAVSRDLKPQISSVRAQLIHGHVMGR